MRRHAHTPHTVPFLARSLSRLATLRLQNPTPTPDEIWSRARAAQNADHLLPIADHVKQQLTAMLSELPSLGRLSPLGQLALRMFCNKHAAQRLALDRLRNKQPALFQAPLERPIIVTGWYRSGTTYLHSLLAKLPGTRAPRAWELRAPLPEPAAAIRRRHTRRAFAFVRYLNPDIQKIHPLHEDNPEECFMLMENSFVSVSVIMSFAAYHYARWLLDQDLSASYADLREQLQLLSNDGTHAARRWVLKCPLHLWHPNELFNTFPDALIVHVRRDWREALPSVCSLATLTSDLFVNDLDVTQLGRFWADYYRVGRDRFESTRRLRRTPQILDVAYADLIGDPARTVARIASAAELPMERSLYVDLNANKRQASSQHRYHLETYGLDDEAIAAQLEPPIAA